MIDSDLRNKLSDLLCYGENGNTLGKILNTDPETVIGALQNSDEHKVLANLSYQLPETLIKGLSLAAQFAGAKHAVLIVPQEKYLETLKKYADHFNVELVVANFINVREFKNALFLHYVTLVNISRLSACKPPCVFVSMDNETLNELPVGKKLSVVFPSKGLKAVLINHRIYKPDVLEKEISEDFDLGSGLISGIKNSDCIVQVALNETIKLREISCGICTFCREGGFQLEATLKGLMKPGTKSEQLHLMKEISEAMAHSFMCSVGAKAAFPTLSGLELFEPEFRAHCGKGTCPSASCEAFLQVFIDPKKCVGCGDCIEVCQKDCIEGKSGFISIIDEFDCDKCGKCVEVCENEAAQFATGRVPRLPDRLTKVGRF